MSSQRGGKISRRSVASIDNVLPGVHLGGNITCLDIIYYDSWARSRSNRTKQNGKQSDALFIVYKDGDNKKHVQVIENPLMDIYFVKPEYRTFKTPREYIEIDKCYPVRCSPKNIIKTVVAEASKADDPLTQQFLKMYYQSCEILNQINDLDFDQQRYYKNTKKNMLKWPYTLMSDIDIESYYRILLGHRYNQMWAHTIDKSFLDIESDVYGLTSSEQNANLDRTNACTVIFDFDPNGSKKDLKPQVFTLLLRDYKRYPQQRYFEEHLSEFVEECHKNFDHQTVKQKNKTKVIDTVADYHIILFDSEADLICTIFKLINTYQPDTCEVWNIAYDIPKLKARLEHNNIDPKSVMCDPRWDPRYRFIDVDIDTRPIDIAERKSSIRMASSTLYIDQMQSYAGIRKGRKAFGSSALDNIANIELGMGKWEFKPGINVLNACIKDYWNFVLYNIRDVWCQVLIDKVTDDTMSIIYNMNQSFCPVKSLYKQITYQRQIYYTQRINKGFLSGNNPNIDYLRGETEEMLEYKADLERASRMRKTLDNEILSDDYSENDIENDTIIIDTEENDVASEITMDIADIYKDSIDRKLYLQGGMVGDPDNNIANGTEMIDGIQSKHVQDDVVDSDYASEYPWAKVTRSLSKSTQFGRCIIPDKISDKQYKLPLGMEKRPGDMKYYTPGAEFTSDYISQDVFSFANVWFGLPDTSEMTKEFGEFLKGDAVSDAG